MSPAEGGKDEPGSGGDRCGGAGEGKRTGLRVGYAQLDQREPRNRLKNPKRDLL